MKYFPFPEKENKGKIKFELLTLANYKKTLRTLRLYQTPHYEADYN
jgi:hypothetical protein